jgi:hypothetical protein
MSNTPALKALVTIPLSVPLPVKDAEGKEASRTSLTMRRPKTRHAKRLAVIIGPHVVSGVLAGETDKVDARELAQSVFQALFCQDKLDALTEIIADMCGEKAEQIDDLDLVDLWAVAVGFAGFFPALQSFASTSLQAIVQPSTAGGPRT